MFSLVLDLKLTKDARRQSQTLCRYVKQMNFIFYYRYATVLYYLNDVEYGGETAFPVVDKNTFDKQVGSQL